MRSVKVELGTRSYEVVVGAGLIDEATSYLPRGNGFNSVVAIVDENVDSLYADRLSASLAGLGDVHKLVVSSGEVSKSLDVVAGLLARMAELRIRRQDLVVTLGGGVVSDLGGFVASIYQRGIGVVHVPTTLLGQVDAAIGGKTGVNLDAGKNLVGTFWQPSAVLADVTTLESLPAREFRSGMAEVIKYGLCYDQSILKTLQEETEAIESREVDVMEDLVFRCAAIKAAVVSQDETDFGGRTILNYGHTFGHALEAAGGYEQWLHGEAVALGMMFAANLARQMGLLDAHGVEVHRRAFEAVDLPVRAAFDAEAVVGAWSIDKKFLDGQRWVLLEGVGHPVIRADVRPDHIQAALAKVLASP
jgi:3-dehydroquinate synthase